MIFIRKGVSDLNKWNWFLNVRVFRITWGRRNSMWGVFTHDKLLGMWIRPKQRKKRVGIFYFILYIFSLRMRINNSLWVYLAKIRSVPRPISGSPSHTPILHFEVCLLSRSGLYASNAGNKPLQFCPGFFVMMIGFNFRQRTAIFFSFFVSLMRL